MIIVSTPNSSTNITARSNRALCLLGINYESHMVSFQDSSGVEMQELKRVIVKILLK